MNNTYGTVKSALVNPSTDVEIWYSYRPTRNSTDTSYKGFRKIKNEEVASIFSNSVMDMEDGESSATENRLVGMYDLKLPVSIFGRKGFYTLYIKPREIEATIKDVGALAAYPDIRGIVIDMNDYGEYGTLFQNDNLTGYRIEYYEQGKRQEYYRIVTSSNMCEPISQNLTSANTNANGYYFNSSATLCFITLTPSTSPSFKSNEKPYIGTPNQRIIITNTKFDPVMVEIEMTEHDIETLSIMAEGEQVRNLENGRITTYNFDGEPYKQQEFLTIKDNYSRNNVYEAKLDKKGNIEETISLEEIKNV